MRLGTQPNRSRQFGTHDGGRRMLGPKTPGGATLTIIKGDKQ
jgi:hypothetical protein